MHFDVIIGNPPYQLSDGGFGTSAAPIYHLFVEQAKRLEPRLLSMVVPARWFAGGKGLDEFRASMLADDRLRVIEDFPDSNDVFSGTQIKGGICFFLWQRDEPGLVTVRTHDKGQVISTATRQLVEPGADVFIRYNEGVGILAKVMKVESEGSKGVKNFELADSKRFSSLVSSRKPFGFDTKFKGAPSVKGDALHLYCNGGDGVVARKDVTVGTGLIDEWKVYIPRAGSGSDAFPHPILGRPFLGGPGSICTETYLCIGPVAGETEARNVLSYISTRLFRFLVLLHKPTQDATRSVYTFVPTQDFSRPWTDDDLYAKYKISKAEVEFIEEMIRPMDLSDE
jgi:site-specific DNA-methyltransferase (adenine-specific)